MAALLACLFTGVPAAAALAPHVPGQYDTDACAMCHRTHTASSGTQWRTPGGWTGDALIVGTADESVGDTQLCFTCHGVDSLGSGADIQSAFQSGSGHRVAPDTSEWGPEGKQCSDCHDSHGTAKHADGTPYAGLLRSQDASGASVYSGDEYCASCHTDRPADTWDGLSVWKETKHASLPAASDAGIVCSACHDPHGSANAPAIRTELTSTALATTTPIPANDRRLCIACHPGQQATYPGYVVYDGGSHGASDATAAVQGEWASEGSSRKVGECQVCHAPMGRKGSDGHAIPKLGDAEGRALCDRCHRAGGAARTDIAGLKYIATAGVNEISAGYSATTSTAGLGALDVYTREATGSSTLIGPRRFRSGDVAAQAAGDLDGDSENELVVTQPNAPTVTVFGRSATYGLTKDIGSGALLAKADMIAIGDAIDDASGLPELYAAQRGDSVVRVYRVSGTLLAPVDSLDAGGPVSGLSIGDTNGDGRDDVAVSVGGSSPGFLVAPGGPALAFGGVKPLADGDRLTDTHDVDSDGSDELVIVSPLSTAPTVSILRDTGAVYATAGSSADASVTAAVIGDVLPGSAGAELVATYAASDGTARVAIHPRSGAGFDAAQNVALPDRSTPRDIAVGDTDGDGDAEAAVALAGTFSRSGSGRGPGLAIVHADAAGTSAEAPQYRYGGGVEAAGDASVVVAELGPLGPSRHPVGAVARSHVSTETAIDTHVECADCHNVHVATSANTTAPLVPGQMLGATGVSVEPSSTGFQLSYKPVADFEYEVCLKCHSSWSDLGQVRSIAAEVTTRAASYHPIEGPAPSTNATGTLVAGVESGSLIRCTDCHGNSDGGQPRGPHRSAAAPLLSRPYVSRPAQDDLTLCFQCHRQDVYAPSASMTLADGVAGIRSGFFGAQGALHTAHADKGFTCASCHVTHGSATMPSLLRDDIGFEPVADGGRCTSTCHDPEATTHTYVRP